MSITQIPQNVASAAKDAADDFRQRPAWRYLKEPHWTRSLAVSALITGAVLLAKGRRKAGLAATVAGAAIALLEEPDQVATVWKRVPSFIDNGKRLLGRLEGFVEEFSGQGDRLRTLLEKTQRQG